MYYLICMAGESLRFQREGCRLPKYMLDVAGRSMFSRALGSLPITGGDALVCLVSEQQAQTYDLPGFIRGEMASLGCAARLDVLAVPKTRGQLETAFLARDRIDPEAQLAIYNIDTAFVSATLRRRFQEPLPPLPRLDGVLGGFPPDGQRCWSFAATDWKDGQQVVTRTAEKTPLPGFALTGLYHFSRAETFFSAASAGLREPAGAAGEYYVAPLYNRLIAQGLEFVVDVVDSITPMGTPEQLRSAIMNYGR